jgi:hypothetical protein
VPEVVLQVMAFGLQRVVVLVLNHPPRAAGFEYEALQDVYRALCPLLNYFYAYEQKKEQSPGL